MERMKKSDLTIFSVCKRWEKVVDIMFCVFNFDCMHHKGQDEVRAQIYCGTWYEPEFSIQFLNLEVVPMKCK